MSRIAVVTYDQVAALADAMTKADVNPTSRAIRERLGNVGSMGTINRLLQRWRGGEPPEAALPVTLPAPLQRMIMAFLADEILNAKAPLEINLKNQEQELADLALENERQMDVIENQAELASRLTEERAAAEGRAMQLSIDLEQAREAAARERLAVEVLRTELAKSQLRLEALPRIEQRIESLDNELGEERALLNQAEQRAAVLAAQIDHQESRMTEHKAALDYANGEIVKVQERADRLTAMLDGERAARSDAEMDAAVLRARNAELDVRFTDYKGARQYRSGPGTEQAVNIYPNV